MREVALTYPGAKSGSTDQSPDSLIVTAARCASRRPALTIEQGVVFTVYKTRAREEHFAVGPSANMLVRHNTAWVSNNTRAHAKPPGTRLGLEKRFL
jgi:hypothetical protein